MLADVVKFENEAKMAIYLFLSMIFILLGIKIDLSCVTNKSFVNFRILRQ